MIRVRVPEVRLYIILTSISMFIYLGLSTWIRSPVIYAHELDTTSTIGAVLHVSPDDNPVAGQNSALVLYFKDTTGMFNLNTCICKLQVIDNGGHVISQFGLIPISTGLSQNPYIFSKAGNYTIKVTGTPQNPDNFDPFVLTFVETVGGSSIANKFPFGIATGFFALQTIALVYIYKAIVRKNS